MEGKISYKGTLGVSTRTSTTYYESLLLSNKTFSSFFLLKALLAFLSVAVRSTYVIVRKRKCTRI